jgi:hypothetical protein
MNHLFKTAYGEYKLPERDLLWCQRCEQWVGRSLQEMPCPGAPKKTCHVEAA